MRREFSLDAETFADLVEELEQVQRVAIREEEILVWKGQEPATVTTTSINPASPRELPAYSPKHLADKVLQSKSALEGERKRITVLFADMKGSVELAEQLNPEQWAQIFHSFFQILSEGVLRFEGTVNQRCDGASAGASSERHPIGAVA